jgi:hypothetical protein
MVSHSKLAAELRTTVGELVRSCSREQRRMASHSLTGDVLRRWTYLPHNRPGLLLGDMRTSQRLLVHRALASVLSVSCHSQLATIMATEDVLDRVEGHRRGRHSTNFWFLAFGEPLADHTWAWRLEGHHLCVHVTVNDDRVAVSPLFLGCNPAVVRVGGRIITAPLWHEEDLARRLLAEVPPDRLPDVIASLSAPPDIYSGNRGSMTEYAVPPGRTGVRVADLPADTRRVAHDLLEFYAQRLNTHLASEMLDDLLGDDLGFSWEGSTERGQGHFYQLVGRQFVIEHDNTANNANHVHNVVRNRMTDFGGDVLAAHLEREAGTDA